MHLAPPDRFRHHLPSIRKLFYSLKRQPNLVPKFIAEIFSLRIVVMNRILQLPPCGS